MDCAANIKDNNTITNMLITSRIIMLETHVKLITGVSDVRALYIVLSH